MTTKLGGGCSAPVRFHGSKANSSRQMFFTRLPKQKTCCVGEREAEETVNNGVLQSGRHDSNVRPSASQTQTLYQAELRPDRRLSRKNNGEGP